MQYVYLVRESAYFNCYDNSHSERVLGVFSSEEKAKEYIDDITFVCETVGVIDMKQEDIVFVEAYRAVESVDNGDEFYYYIDKMPVR